MNSAGTPIDKNKKEVAFNITLAAVAGQVGCVTLLIILVALFGGLWLDKQMGTRPMFTLGLTIASVPVTLIIMFWVVRKATSKFQAGSSKKTDLQTKEETISEEFK